MYQSAFGSLMYLLVGTRPDITYTVSNLARFSSKSTTDHWNAVKKVMRYLRGTTKLGIHYFSECSKELIGYSDADWGGDINDRKSTSGYIFKLNGGVVSWRSKKTVMCHLVHSGGRIYCSISSCTRISLAESTYFWADYLWKSTNNHTQT